MINTLTIETRRNRVFNTLRRMLWMIGPRSFLACFHMRADYNRIMATIAKIEKLAQDSSEHDRAVLAAHLLESLPPVLHDEDEGIGEALRRDAELETNPSARLTMEQLDQRIERR